MGILKKIRLQQGVVKTSKQERADDFLPDPCGFKKLHILSEEAEISFSGQTSLRIRHLHRLSPRHETRKSSPIHLTKFRDRPPLAVDGGLGGLSVQFRTTARSTRRSRSDFFQDCAVKPIRGRRLMGTQFKLLKEANGRNLRMYPFPNPLPPFFGKERTDTVEN